MAGDSGVFDTESGAFTTMKTTKVWRWDDILFGVAGSPRATQIIQHWLPSKGVIDQFAAHDGTVENYMVTCLLPAIKNLFDEHGFGEHENDVASMDATFLVGAREQLFELQSDYAMMAVSPSYHSIGSGRDTALGALDILVKSKKSPENILKEALLATEKHNAFVRRPFVFVST